ncbi:YebC/PmpR family DNA-binding regulatory protein [Panacagrimonas perspica]|uniref:Probable transcriptional regulatory protein DFR24_1358 n=1 Tax=Panacagrimonas perspica TaxID=381431 RepID=A0A4S3K8Q5_9GAMM|nr:YebC/PmpR family DNA-binding transcriptional regulator [Panacagrimonas perspica]TDU31973.1 YebC/PmpR family DNA-binding regulatory protein [Panacagrimonas perspica]THD04488.1 transcriptional regulator [Panacagrimonas perspica]
MGRGPSIEGRKGVADAQKAKVFTKLIREISLAAKQGGPDPAANSRLRLAVVRAMDANMTRDRVEAAIKRASGEGADASTEVRYEGYAPGGVAVLVDCVTDNPTRTVADVRHAFSKAGGSMGTSGSVAFQFAQVGQLWFELKDSAQEDRILELALDAGADDVQGSEGWCEVLTAPGSFEQVRKALADAGFAADQARVTMRPANIVPVAAEAAADIRKLLEKLEELDDVQDVFHNAELP